MRNANANAKEGLGAPHRVGLWTAVLVTLLWAGLGQAQSRWGWDEGAQEAEEAKPVAAAQAPARSGSSPANAGKPARRGYEFEGPYAQFGIAVGEVDFDGDRFGGNRLDADASGGFTLTGGYRLRPWLSAEANFTYLGGGEIDGTNDEVDYFAFVFGPKFYPFGAFRIEDIPDHIQPYAMIQIGGGEIEIDGTSYEEDSFIARFIIGFDYWIDDHLGVFVEGGGHVPEEDRVDGIGIFTFGGQWRF